jgi:hypothetical protein
LPKIEIIIVVKIVLAKKYKNDTFGVLAIQSISDGIKTQKRIGIKIKQEHFDIYFIKSVNRFYRNKEFNLIKYVIYKVKDLF